MKRTLSLFFAVVLACAMLPGPPAAAINWTFGDNVTVNGDILGDNATRLLWMGDLQTRGPWVDVRAFGATGDGVTDDSAAIQAAIDNAYSTGVGTAIAGTVLVPKGRYRIRSTVTLKPRITLAGMGAMSSILYTSDNITMLQVGDNTAMVDTWAVRDLYLLGSNGSSSQIGLKLNGTASYSVNNGYVENVRIGGFGGAYITAAYSYIAQFNSVEVGVSSSTGQLLNLTNTCNHFIFSNCLFYWSTYAGYSVSVKGQGHTFDHCAFEFNTPSLGTVVVGDNTYTDGDAQSIRFLNSYFYDNHNNPIISVMGGYDTNVLIQGNRMASSSAPRNTYAIDLVRGRGHIIQGNSFSGTWDNAIIHIGSQTAGTFISYNRDLQSTTTLSAIYDQSGSTPNTFIVPFVDAYNNSSGKWDNTQTKAKTVYVGGDQYSQMVNAYASGDNTMRFYMRADGYMGWGPGNASTDTSLYRTSNNCLKSGGRLLLTDGIGLGNQSSGDVTATSKTYKIPVYFDNNTSMGYIQIYAGP